jgi:hypothetical protein
LIPFSLRCSAYQGPSAVRGQLYGIAAAVGKVGAFIGSYTFKPIIKDLGGSGTYKGSVLDFFDVDSWHLLRV